MYKFKIKMLITYTKNLYKLIYVQVNFNLKINYFFKEKLIEKNT